MEKFLIAVRQKVTKNQPTAYINPKKGHYKFKEKQYYSDFWYSGKQGKARIDTRGNFIVTNDDGCEIVHERIVIFFIKSKLDKRLFQSNINIQYANKFSFV